MGRPHGALCIPRSADAIDICIGAAGTGIQRVEIHYLDNLLNIQTLRIELAGTNPVLTPVNNIYRINSLHAIRVGSGGVAAGNISLTAVGGAITYGYISAGNNTARQAIYTVPNGYNGYINHWQASSGSASNHFAQISLEATTLDDELWPGVFLLQDEQGTQNGGLSIDFPIPIPIPAGADVKISAISDAGAANVTALGAIMGWFEAIAE